MNLIADEGVDKLIANPIPVILSGVRPQNQHLPTTPPNPRLHPDLKTSEGSRFTPVEILHWRWMLVCDVGDRGNHVRYVSWLNDPFTAQRQ